MFQPLLELFSTENPSPQAKKHRRRFGIIPAEPCRASSMQTLQESPCSEKTVSDRFEN